MDSTWEDQMWAYSLGNCPVIQVDEIGPESRPSRLSRPWWGRCAGKDGNIWGFQHVILGPVEWSGLSFL